MSIASLKDLYIDELGDLYDAEAQTIRALARLSEAARAPELKEALSRHCDEPRLHLERLQLIFTHWGTKIPLRRCAGVAGIVQEADERVTEPATADTRDAAIIGAAQRIEHYEIAAYGCARSYARRLNRPDEARLLQETLDGLVVDATSGAPRYVVVDADGLFSWRRSLLPMTIVRFDRSAHLLRVPLDKDIASRYPAFDRDEFDGMDDDAVRQYEARLLGFFPKEDGALRVPKHGEGELPEWMVQSAGLTGTPVDLFADPSLRRREDEAPTPPHGEKLR